MTSLIECEPTSDNSPEIENVEIEHLDVGLDFAVSFSANTDVARGCIKGSTKELSGKIPTAKAMANVRCVAHVSKNLGC